MEDQSRILLAPRTSMVLCLGALPPLAVGLPTGGLAASVGGAFMAAGPLLMASRARWPRGAPRLVPLYFAALFLVALAAFDFNSPVFIVDTWSALLLGLAAVPPATMWRWSQRPTTVVSAVRLDVPARGRWSSAVPTFCPLTPYQVRVTTITQPVQGGQNLNEKPAVP